MTRSSYVRGAIYGGVLLATLGGVVAATRGDGAPAGPAGHVHDASAGTTAAQPVSLSSDESRRIGVTYAVATVGPLEKDVRSVGQITYDETRLRTIVAKVDGYV